MVSEAERSTEMGGRYRVTHMVAQSDLDALPRFPQDLGFLPGQQELHTQGTA